MLLAAADLWRDNQDVLGDIDSRFGDGDHGVTIGKISGATTREVLEWGEEVAFHDFLAGLGSAVIAVGGGSAGSLYGTLFSGLGTPLTDENEIGSLGLQAMFKGSLESMYEITKARVGDKTMMDALIPAVEAALAASGGPGDILKAAADAAVQGAEATRNLISKFGRARSYGGQTIGTPDAGSISTSLLFQGLYSGFINS